MRSCCQKLSPLCVILAMASIVGSIAIWYLSKGSSAEEIAHAERFGIFVGLWAPTFLGLANYLRGSCSRDMDSNASCSSEPQKKTGCCNS